MNVKMLRGVYQGNWSEKSGVGTGYRTVQDTRVIDLTRTTHYGRSATRIEISYIS